MNNIMQLPNCIILFYIALFGLCVGSFLNVAILRGLSGEDMVFERSRCPKCKTQLKWYMNIPLLSFIFLKGKCGFCKEKISFQYPLIEFITSLCFVFSYIAFGFSLKTLFICIFLSIFILMSATDFKETVIIDYHAYILLFMGLLYSFLNLGNINIIQSIIGAIFGFLFFELFSRIGLFLIKCRIFGEGDSLIALGLGAIFGPKALAIIIALSILIQSICALPILCFKALKIGNKKLSFAYILTTFAILLAIYLNFSNIIENLILYYLILFFVIIISIWSLIQIIKDILHKKNSQNIENVFNLMPFGPALLISATICLFYLEQIKNFILNFLLQV